VELLVVIAIIGVLIALLLPAIQAARESSRRTKCQNHLRQMGVAIQNYVGANKKFPAGKKYSGPRNLPTTQSLSWSSFLLEHLEQGNTFQKLDFSVPLSDPVQTTARTRRWVMLPSQEELPKSPPFSRPRRQASSLAPLSWRTAGLAYKLGRDKSC
jgi:type II secretory pathway pseudopilin PulG